jgi:hypothetical protein
MRLEDRTEVPKINSTHEFMSLHHHARAKKRGKKIKNKTLMAMIILTVIASSGIGILNANDECDPLNEIWKYVRCNREKIIDLARARGVLYFLMDSRMCKGNVKLDEMSMERYRRYD